MSRTRVLPAAAAAAYFFVRWGMRCSASLRRLEGSVVSLREDADEIRGVLTSGGGSSAPAATTAEPESSVPSEELDRAASAIQDLKVEVRSASEQSRETASTLRALVGAVSEYGMHLRSHTAVMQGLATTTERLQEAANQLAVVVTRSAAQPRPASPEPSPPTRDEGERGAGRPSVDVEPWHEPFTASDLRWPNLTRTAHGYPIESVDRLLDRAADALDLVERERNSLRERLLVVETRLAVLTRQQEFILQSRMAALREKEGVDAQARRDATLALEEASRRVANMARDVEEQQERVLRIARSLGERKLAAGTVQGVDAGSRRGATAPPASQGGAPLPARSASPASVPPPVWPSHAQATARASSSVEPSRTPPSSGTAPTPSPSVAPDETLLAPAPSPLSGSDVQRREPPDVPPVWEVIPLPKR